MSNRTTFQELVRYVERKADSRIADSELLRRFHQLGDQQAFEMIVTRYGSLVRAACLRATRDSHHADDAFQATFLILARKAQTIRQPEALPAWLVRVARRAVMKRRPMQPITAEPLDSARSPLDQLSAREFLLLFDEELDRLPVNYRSALLLCMVEGKTVEETARQLGTTHGTARGWLQRGRERLRQRLKRRGLELSTVLPAVALYYSTPASAAVHQSLQSMLNGSAAIPANISVLISGTSLAGMFGSVAAVIFLGAILAGASLLPRSEELPTVIASTSQPPSSTPIDTDQTRLPQDAIARIGSNSFRQGGEVTALAYSKDNRYLASASPADFENSVRVWEMATGKEILRVPIQSNFRESTIAHRPVAVAFSENNKQLRVLDWASFRAFDLISGKELTRHDFGVPDTSNQFFPKERVIGTAFSPDGQRYAAVRGTGELVIGDVNTSLPTTTIPKCFNLAERYLIDHVNITFSPDSNSVCVPSHTNVMLFDVKTGKRLNTYQLNGQIIRKAILTGPHELSCIVSDANGSNSGLLVVDMATSNTVHQSQLRAWDTLAFSANGKWLAIGNGAGNRGIMILDRTSKKVVHHFQLLLQTVALEFSQDSRWLAHTNNAGAIMIWNVDNSEQHPLSTPSEFMQAQFEQDGVLRVTTEKALEYFDWRTCQKVSQTPRTWNTFTTYSPDRRLKVVNQQGIIITDIANNKELCRFKPSDYCRRIAFTADNRSLIGITQRDTIHLWDFESKTDLWSHKLPERSFGIVGTGDPQLSRDGRWMALGCVLKSDAGEGYAIRVFDLQHKKEHACISAPNFIYGGICISPDGRFVAGGGGRPMGQTEEDAVFVWEVATGKRSNTLRGHVLGNNTHCNGEIRCQFTPDGRKLLTIDGKGIMRLWELSSGQVLWKSPENHGGPSFSISPDGAVIVSSSFDAPVLLWDLYGNARGPGKNAKVIDAEKLWSDLAGEDGGKAFAAIRQLCAAPDEAIKLLREKLAPTKPRPKEAIAKWIKNLDSSVFTEREQAFKEVLNILEEVEPQLRQVRAATTSDEVRRRVDSLLLKTGKPSPDRLRHERSLDVLEHLGTPEAKQLLETLASRAGNTPLTLGARAALERLTALKTQPQIR